MSGDSTKERLRYLVFGSSGWSISKPPPPLDKVPVIRTLPRKSPAKPSPPAASHDAGPSAAGAFLFTTGLHLVSAYDTQPHVAASRFAASWNPRVEYRARSGHHAPHPTGDDEARQPLAGPRSRCLPRQAGELVELGLKRRRDLDKIG